MSHLLANTNVRTESNALLNAAATCHSNNAMSTELLSMRETGV